MMEPVVATGVIETLEADGIRPVFHLRADAMSYVFGVTRHGHLEHLHFGRALPSLTASDLDAVRVKVPRAPHGVLYLADDPDYCLDLMPLEHSGLGKGDYRLPPAEIKMPDGSFVTDFTYRGHTIHDGTVAASGGLPTAIAGEDDCQTLEVRLADGDVHLTLYYTVFPAVSCVTRRCVLTSAGDDPVVIRKLMSFCVDLPNRPFDLVTFDGADLTEARRHQRPVAPGTYTNSSITGFSSNRHNPGILLTTRGATEDSGEVWGFNLVYSGSHETSVELTQRDLVRVQGGINPVGFEWKLTAGESFETPEAVLTYSDEGRNGMSAHMHGFVSRHIVRGPWADRERPILANTWEATFFNYTHGSLVSLARRARAIGAELFVLDDGWFGHRDTDSQGLGDYSENRRRLAHGLKGVSDAVTSLGMGFGLWFEPEMVNPDSDLYREHPDWIVRVPGRTPSQKRYQYVLDLCRPEVRDHIVANVTRILDTLPIAYVKWDANRAFSDMFSPSCPAGEFGHRYILGLYEVLRRIFGPRPQVLLETCSSGGNRFDLGMLCFGPQIWASDCTDPVARLETHLGLSHLYPQSTMGSHVTASPSPVTLRNTPVVTRFNVAALGVLGYELDLSRVEPAERAEMVRQVEFYKQHRRLAQFGRLRRHEPTASNQTTVSISDAASDTHLVAHFQREAIASQPAELMPMPPLRPERRYRVASRRQTLGLLRFGRLVEYISPVPWVRAGSLLMRLAARFYRLPDGDESYVASGAALRTLRVAPQFEGMGYDPSLRLLGDWGSRLYTVEPAES